MHGVEPTLPLDLIEATYMSPTLNRTISHIELLARRANDLQRRSEDLATAHDRVLASRFKAAHRFRSEYEHSIKEYNFEPGALVLARNTRVEKELNRKTKHRYLGPLVVARRTKGGSYILADMDGSLYKNRFAATRVIPYHPRSQLTVPLTQHVQRTDRDLDELATMQDDIAEDQVDIPADWTDAHDD